jgi:hypothetical protein
MLEVKQDLSIWCFLEASWNKVSQGIVYTALHIRDEIVPIFGLLQPAKRHLGSRDVFFGVL